MFWLSSISSVAIAGFVLRLLHVSELAKSTFYIFLSITLLLFNLAIATVLACFWNDGQPWTKPKMLLGLVAVTLGLALLVRLLCPVKLRNLTNHKAILKTYSVILFSCGLIAGLIFGSPVFTGFYTFQSDRWADIGAAVAIVEITSLYTLVLALVLSIGASVDPGLFATTGVDSMSGQQEQGKS